MLKALFKTFLKPFTVTFGTFHDSFALRPRVRSTHTILRQIQNLLQHRRERLEAAVLDLRSFICGYYYYHYTPVAKYTISLVAK